MYYKLYATYKERRILFKIFLSLISIMLFAKDYLTINQQRPFSIKRTKTESHQILTNNVHTFEKRRYNDFATNTTNRFIEKKES